MERGLTGYFLTPHVGAFRRTLPLADHLPRSVGPGRVDDLIERPESEQYLERWDVADCIRLGVSAELCQETESSMEGTPQLSNWKVEQRTRELIEEVA